MFSINATGHRRQAGVSRPGGCHSVRSRPLSPDRAPAGKTPAYVRICALCRYPMWPKRSAIRSATTRERAVISEKRFITGFASSQEDSPQGIGGGVGVPPCWIRLGGSGFGGTKGRGDLRTIFISCPERIQEIASLRHRHPGSTLS